MNKPKRILIVDDEELNRDLLQDMIESLGYEVKTASDGVEAIAKAGFDIDLVLMDVMMPDMDGFEAASRIRKDYNENQLPIVMVTALK